MNKNKKGSSDEGYISEEEFDDISIEDEVDAVDEFDKSSADFERDFSAKLNTSNRPTSAFARDSLGDSKRSNSIMKKEENLEKSESKPKTVSFDNNLLTREPAVLESPLKSKKEE